MLNQVEKTPAGTTRPGELASKDYLAFLDGLRAFAVISVVAYHLAGNSIPSGYLGVDVFFVISGFVVSFAVAGRYRGQSILPFVADFYARRFTRIMPALLACILVSTLATFLFIPEAWLSTSLSETAYFALFGLSNIFLARGTDYFSPVTEFNPFTHTWSLGVEEQFYVVFPLLFFPWVLGSRGRRISLGVYAAAAIISAALWLRFLSTNPLQAFYMTHARFWQLACGILCFQVVSQIRRGRAGTLCNSIATIALIGLLATFLTSLGTGGLQNIAAVAFTTLLIGCLYYLRDDRSAHLAVLELPAVRFIGKISYSLYLWHWPVFVLARWTVGTDTIPTKLTALLVAVALSLASYFWIEKPTRRSKLLAALPDVAVVTLFLAVIGAAWYGFNLIRDNQYHIALSKVTRNRAEWYDSAPNTFPEFPGCVAMSTGTTDSLTFERAGCTASKRDETLFVLGDSHARAYIPLLKRFTLATGIRTTIVWTAGCGFLSLNIERDMRLACRRATDASAAYVAKLLRPGDVLFLPSLRLPRLFSHFGGPATDGTVSANMLGPDGDARLQKAVHNAVDILRPFSQKGAAVIFEGPKPVFKEPPYRCSDWFNKMNPICAGGQTIDRQFIETVRAPILKGYAEIAAALPNIHVWDPLPTLCPAATCSTFRDGHPMFFDGDHITAYANKLLASDFVAAVDTALKK